LPERFELKQNYPDPFNPITQISYYIPQSRCVSLRINDVTGKQIQTIVNGIIEEGYYSLQFDGQIFQAEFIFINYLQETLVQ